MILKFQIAGTIDTQGKKMQPKDALLGWSKQYLQQYPDVNIKDFHQSWQDGFGFCALVDRLLPGKIEYGTLNVSLGIFYLVLNYFIESK